MPHQDSLTLDDQVRPTTAESWSILSSPYRLTTIGIVSLVALIAFEALAVATAMPAVARALDGVPLYAVAFGVTLATSVVGMTVAGGWCDARGPAATLWSGMACFVAGLLLAGFAPSMPALSGLVVEHLGWRWVFLGVPLLALPAGAMLRPALQGLGGHGQGMQGGVRRGLWALGAATGICLLYVGGQRQSAGALGAVAVAAALSLVCTWKLLPAGTLRAGRGLPSVIALRGLVFAAFFGAEAFLPLVLAREHGLSAPMAGLVLSAGALGWCSASWYQGHSRNGWSRHRFLRVGTSAVLAGVLLTASVAWPAVPVWMAVVGWIVSGLGMGLLSASLSVLTLSMSAPGEQGANSSALQLCEAIAVAATLAIGGSLFAALLETSAQAAYLANFGVAAGAAVLAAVIVGRTDTRQVFVG